MKSPRVRGILGMTGASLLAAAIWLAPPRRPAARRDVSPRARASVLETCARAVPWLGPLVSFSLWVDAAGNLEAMRFDRAVAGLRAYTRWLADDPRAWDRAAALLVSVPPTGEAPGERFGEARALVTDGIAMHPRDAGLRFRRGWLAIREGLGSREVGGGIPLAPHARIAVLESAVRDLDAALALAPGLRAALEWRAEALRALARERTLECTREGAFAASLLEAAAALWSEAGEAYARLEALHSPGARALARYGRGMAAVLAWDAGGTGGRGGDGGEAARVLAELQGFPLDDTARVYAASHGIREAGVRNPRDRDPDERRP